ncbi:MAG TPA: hypothetical protein VF057_08840 [Thermoanaerobaculia bacterium]
MTLPDHLRLAADASRATLRVGYPWWLRLFLLRGIAGITLGRRIYVAPHIAGSQLERLVRHELAHVRQIARLGIFRFYWRYAVEYVRNRRSGMSSAGAYRNISFEKEAFAAEENV